MSYGERRYGGGASFGAKPVETGKEYDVQISEISRQGDGIARVQGFVIFVKGARVGEKTKVRILNLALTFATELCHRNFPNRSKYLRLLLASRASALLSCTDQSLACCFLQSSEKSGDGNPYAKSCKSAGI